MEVQNGNKKEPGRAPVHVHVAVPKLEQTLAIIKPEAMPKLDEILNIIRREGFSILQTRRVHMRSEDAAQFYADQSELEWFTEAVTHLSSGEIVGLTLGGPRAIEHWLQLIGPESYEERRLDPTCLRARFGRARSDFMSGFHGSANETDALREIHFFFPARIVEPVLSDNYASYYLNENVHPVLTVGLSRLVREQPDDPVIWLADWLLAHNPNKPRAFTTGICQ